MAEMREEIDMDERRDIVDDLDWDEDDEDSQKNQFLTFRLGAEDYGIGIRHITEIIGVQKITEVPDMPPFIKGVINLRGQVIPIMDVRSRFGMDLRDYDERTCIIVVRIREVSVGLIVDTVQEVLGIPEDDVAPPPRVNRAGGSRYIHGMGKAGDKVKILLDANKLLFDEEIEAVEAVA